MKPDRLAYTREVAALHDWEEIDYQPATRMVSFRRLEHRVNVYFTRMTVGICANGRQSFRKRVTMEELEDILNRPNRYCH